jgi:hypothetical protein
MYVPQVTVTHNQNSKIEASCETVKLNKALILYYLQFIISRISAVFNCHFCERG